MNNRAIFMNNITTEHAPLTLDFVNRVPLWENWKNCCLEGHYWRLYWHDNAGAGLWLHGRKWPLLPGRLYLLPPDCGLRTWCEGREVNQLYIHFEVPDCCGSPRHLCSEIPLSPWLEAIAGQIFAAPGVNRIAALALASAAFLQLPPEARPPRETDPELAELINQMRARLFAELDLEQFARRLGISVNTLIRRFRGAYGCTPYHYLTTMRYSVAARLLEEDKLAIDEICEYVGVRDRFHFSRMFKTRYGLSPGRYRASRARVT